MIDAARRPPERVSHRRRRPSRQRKPLRMREERDVVDRDDKRTRQPKRRRVTGREEHVDIGGRERAWQARLFPHRSAARRRFDLPPIARSERGQSRRGRRGRKTGHAVRERRIGRPLPKDALEVAADARRLAEEFPSIHADVQRRAQPRRRVRSSTARRPGLAQRLARSASR